MPEVEITRKQIIVVGEVGTNSYGDLTWTDKDSKPYKVKSTRKQYFEAIVPGQAVEISFSEYRGTEYPYSAVAVKDKLPSKVAPDAQFERLKQRQMDKGEPVTTPAVMTKSDWADKDRITRKSIERQTALKEANLRVPSEEDASAVIATAKLFEAYLEGNYLVEEAKRLIEKNVN